MLFSALALVRAAPPLSRGDRELDVAWRTVSDWLARRMPGAPSADVRQEALVKVLRRIDTCEAQTATSCAAWLMRVARRSAIDAERSARASPIDRALLDHAPDGPDPLDSIASPDAGAPLRDTALEELVAELEEALERALVDLHPDPAGRVLPRARARARLWRRLLRRSVAEVRDALAWHAPLGDAVISKWIERGREPLDAAVRRWVDDAPEERGELGRRLRAALGERRLDAGRPRPERRTRGDGAGRRPSVASGGARPGSCGPGSMHRSGRAAVASMRRSAHRPGSRGGPAGARRRTRTRGRR